MVKQLFTFYIFFARLKFGFLNYKNILNLKSVITITNEFNWTSLIHVKA